MNSIPCKRCVHFHEQKKLAPKGQQPNWFGYCAVQSTYPAEDRDGQLSPPDCVRAAPGELANYKLVQPNEVVRNCLRVVQA